ncbi:hypothetical protein WKK05_11355 [Nostoc sp. UHCC 0302]
MATWGSEGLLGARGLSGGALWETGTEGLQWGVCGGVCGGEKAVANSTVQ